MPSLIPIDARSLLPWVLPCLVSAVLVGCRDHVAAAGTTDDGDSSSAGSSVETSSTGGEPSSCAIESREPVRRLSAFEYTRALQDLVGVEIDEALLPASSSTTVFATDDAALGSSALLVDGQFDATVIAGQAVLARMEADGASFMGCVPSDPACIDTWLSAFGKRAHRRPLADDERDRLRALFDEVTAADGRNVAVAATVQALLLSPRFGFHVEELDEDGRPDDYAIASRLSFLLWSSAPDEALLDAARRGVLRDRAERTAQAERMLMDPRAAATMVRMVRELLDLEALASVDPIDPRWSASLRAEMDAEIDRFIETTVFAQDGTLAALLTSRWVDAGPQLAALYGIAAGTDELPVERAGLVTRAGFLAGMTSGASPSPVRRGLVVLDRLACTAIAPPPPDVPEIPAGDAGLTNRDRYEQHTADPSCAGCHLQIDPIGFALEHFDAIGAYRSVDNGQPIDASGAVLGVAIDGAFELSTALADSDVVATCAVTQWLRFGLGHALRDGEACARDELAADFIAAGGDLPTLLVDIAASPLMVE